MRSLQIFDPASPAYRRDLYSHPYSQDRPLTPTPPDNGGRTKQERRAPTSPIRPFSNPEAITGHSWASNRGA